MPLFADRPDGCCSIDGGPEDPGFSYLKTSIIQMGLPNVLHPTTALAIGNVLGALATSASRTVDLIGHGHFGLFLTGCGRTIGSTCADDKKIDGGRPGDWDHLVHRLHGKADIIRLWGCYTGAEANGKTLLQAIHLLTGATVIAPAVLIQWSGNKITKSPSGTIVWQKISADEFDPPIVPVAAAPPRPPVPEIHTPGRSLNITEIEAVTIESLLADGQPFRLEGEPARQLFASLGISEFPKASSTPASIVTHRIRVDTATGPIWFGIYNERYLFPEEMPTDFEIVSSQFLQLSAL